MAATKWSPFRLGLADPRHGDLLPLAKAVGGVGGGEGDAAARPGGAGRLAGAMARLSTPLVRYLMTGRMKPAGWLFSYMFQPA